MTATTATLDLHALAARLAALEDRKADIEQEIAALRAALLAAAPEGSTITVAGQPRWRVNPGRKTFSEAKAIELLPAAVLEMATVQKIDGAKVRKISEALWETCTTQGAAFLTAVK